MRQFLEVLVFSYRERIRAKVFLYTTLFVVALLALVMSAPKIEAMFSDDQRDAFAVVDQTGQYVNAGSLAELTKASNDEVSWKIQSDGDEAKIRELLEVEESEWTGYFLVQQPTAQGQPPTIKLIAKENPDPVVVQALQTHVQSQYTMQVAQGLKLTPDQLKQIMSQVALEVDDLSKSKDEDIQNSYIPIYAMIMFLSISIISFGSAVATAVAAEKSSRIMEVMITKVRPIWLMYGKVVGVGFAGLTQIAIIAVVSIAFSRLLYEGPIEFGSLRLDLSLIEPMMYVYFLTFYVLGYFFYATLYAAVGSLVSRSEEVNQVIMPVTTIFMVAMYSAMFSMGAPESTFAVVGSFVPFLTPLMMFIRVGMSDVPTIQVIVSIAILVLSIGIGCWIAAKIYRVGVLTYGKRPTWKEIVAAIKMYRV